MQYIAFLFIILIVSCNAAVFNTSIQADCVNGCKFSNASIWENNEVPLPNDNVTITFDPSSLPPPLSLSSLSLIIDPAAVNLNSITLSFANVVIPNTHLNVGIITSDVASSITIESANVFISQGAILNGSLNLQPNSTIYKSGETNGEITFGAFVHMEAQTKINWAGTCNIQGNFSAKAEAQFWCSNLQIQSNSFVNFVDTLASGSIKIDTTNSITLGGLWCDMGLSLGANSSVDVYNSFNAQVYLKADSSLSLINVEAGIINNKMYGDSSPLDGTGWLIITDSVLTIMSKSPKVSSSSIVVFGETLLTALNITIQNLECGVSANHEHANLTLVGDNLILNGSSHLSGQLNAFGSGITIDGVLFIVGGNILVENSTLSLGGNVTSSSILIGEHSTLSIHQASFIIGNLINHGVVMIGAQYNTLVISGNYTQTKGADLNVILHYGSSSPALTASNIEFSGQVEYNIGRKPLKSHSFWIAYASNYLNSSIYAEDVSGSPQLTNLRIAQSDKSIYLEYKLNVKDLPVWVYIVASLGGLLIITIIVVVVVMRCKKRKDYDSI